MEGKRVKFEMEYKGVSETLYGELVESRGNMIVRGEDGRVYSLLGWEELKE